MSGETLYTIACEMLRKTNPYKIDIEDIFYGKEEKQKKLIDLVSFNLGNSANRHCTPSTDNYYIAYDAIAEALVEYIENLEGHYSFRRKTRTMFAAWLKDIRKAYKLEKEKSKIPEVFLFENGEEVIEMVKALHRPKGVSKAELVERLAIQSRSIQKNLRRLSPDLYEGSKTEMGDEYKPFHIGGQPVTVKIKIIEEKNNSRRYKTPNTLHPIILQENLLEVEILLKSLSLSCDRYNSNISTRIAFDIWSQLSDYAKEKIKKDFAYEDDIHQEFIKCIDEDCPTDYACSFSTQREMIDLIDGTIFDVLSEVEKIPDRTCFLRYKDEDGNRFSLEGVRINRINNQDYIAVDNEGREYLFREEWIGSIIIE